MALMRRLDCSWRELQDMPEEIVDVFEAIFAGEDHHRLEQQQAAAHAAASAGR